MANSKSIKQHPAFKPLLVFIIATVTLILFVGAVLLLMPRDAIPEFTISDRNGTWEAQGEVAVFDDKINPGSSGVYYFKIKNESEAPLRYGINMYEYINTMADVTPFMKYRLKLDGVNLNRGDDEAWHSINELNYFNIVILPGDVQLLELEWEWPFEEDNERDTLIGRAGGKLSAVFHAIAEVIEVE